MPRSRDESPGTAMRTARLPVASLLLAIAGIAVAGYLTVVHFRPALLTCTIGGCHTVQTSRYAEVAGVPVAVLGLAMYLVLAGLAAIRLLRPHLAETLTIIGFAVVFAGAIYAAYLTYVEVAVIHAICQWCVLSAVVTGLILVLEGVLLIELFTRTAADDPRQEVSAGGVTRRVT